MLPMTAVSRKKTRAQQLPIWATIWPLQTWAKKGRAAVPLLGREGAGSPSNTMWPGVRPTCVPSDMLIHPTVWPRYRQTVQTTVR